MKKLNLVLLSLAILTAFITVPAMAQNDELLPPEKAFALTARMQGDQLIAEYEIAEGYYMYRQRFDFQIEGDAARFDTVIIPDGKVKHDEFFGDMEVYRNSVKIALPIIKNAASPSLLKVRSTGQGCADIGVCYPPLQQTLMVDTTSSAKIMPVAYVPSPQKEEIEETSTLQAFLANVTGSADQESVFKPEPAGISNALSILQSLGQEIGLTDEDEIPHPDEAFILSAALDDDNTIQSEILMAKNIYLYRDKIKIELVEGSGHLIPAIDIPRGKEKYDEFLGDTEVFYDLLKVSIPIVSTVNASDTYSLSYQYQGCVEDRICYPPITKYLTIDGGTITVSDQLDNDSKVEKTGVPSESTGTSSQTAPPQSEQDKFAGLLQNVSLLSILLFYLAGIGLTFTPCVFPMIPILSSIIAGQGENITTTKAFSSDSTEKSFKDFPSERTI